MSAPRPPAKGDLLLCQAYLEDKRLLVVDTSKAIRASIAKTLLQLGAQSHNVVMASTFSDAKGALLSGKFDGVICDYTLGDRSGIELMRLFRQSGPEARDGLFVLVTANASESAVAEAAEEDVDSYILKPFTASSLGVYLLRAVAGKVRPSGYVTLLREGRSLLASGETDKAIAKIEDAKKLNSKPSLACYYLGKAYETQKQPDKSEFCYHEGLIHNEFHYKCSVALFDLYIERNDIEGAYKVIHKLARVFPLSPNRLGKTIELAIRTHNYADVIEYYNAFSSIDERRDDLRRTVTAALVVGGQFHLRKGKNAAAFDLFRKAAATSGSHPATLKEIILGLIAHWQVDEAEAFLKKFPAESQKGSDFLVSEYVVLDQRAASSALVEHGRKLIQRGILDPLVYKILIRRSRELDFKASAEDLAREAMARWPSEAGAFKALLA